MNPIPDESKKLAEYLRNVFDDSYQHSLDAFKRMEAMQRAYECMIPDEWATYSQIYLPYIRTAVEQAMPDVWNYLFPKSGMINLVPESPMSYDKVTAVREYIEDLITKKIGLKKDGFLTLKDAIKFNVGYGIIESEVSTPVVPLINTILSSEEPVEVRRMGLGAPVETVRYNYVNWRLVVPTPDGDSPENVSGVFHLVPMREDAFKRMYAYDKTQKTTVYKGNVEEIIKNVRDGQTSMAHYPIWWVMSQFTESSNVITNVKAMNEIRKISVAQDSPIVIPVMKFYAKNEHIWMTPDGTIIYHIKEKDQALRCPIIKATPVPDGGNWFPKGDVEAGRDAADGANIFKNALMDLMTLTLHPTAIVNRMTVQDENVGLEPHSRIDAYGKVGDAIEYLQPPPMPASLQGYGQDLEYQFAQANGQPLELRGQGTAGVMRGGGGAFESLLQTTMARSKMASAVLEMGWLQDVISHALILVQINGLDDSFIVEDDLTKSFIEKTITADELRENFRVTVDLEGKFRKTASEQAMNMALYRDIMKDNDRFDWNAIDEWILGDDELARKLRASPEVQQKQAEQLQERMKAEQEAGQGQGSGSNQPGQNPGEQAMMGGSSQAGGVV